MNRKRHVFPWVILAAATCCNLARGQAPVILTIDTENVVEYQADTSDVSKYATNPNITPAAPIRNFTSATPLGDIVAVNGQQAKGLYASRVASIISSPTPDPTLGGAIADTAHPSIRQQIFDILKTDGTPIGTIVGLGMSGGTTPGSPALVKNGDWAIVGGTGAFLGVRGQMGRGTQTVTARAASATEDPGNRRVNGGGKLQWVLTLLPMFTPQILITASGPAVAHSADFTFVNASKPAAAGEILSLFMTGLGPTQPGVDPGKPFPATPAQVVNSPVEVLVNGKSAQVLAAVGFPGAIDGYQVNFRMPTDATKGLATVQVSAAWITGTSVNIAVQ
jgi:hypothetical protein